MTNLNIKIISNSTNLILNEKLKKFYKKIKYKVNITEYYIEDFRLLKKDKNKYDVIIINYDLISINNFFKNFYDNYYENKLKKFKKKIILDLRSIKQAIQSDQQVLINNFYNHNLNPNSSDRFNKFIIDLNYFLKKNFKNNYKIINIDQLIRKNGLANSVDLTKFYLAKILYTEIFIDEYIKSIKYYLLEKTIYKKKIIILDGDNTLWNGILGDDGVSKIKNNNSSRLSNFFLNAQKVFKELKQNGVLLAICSKNNFNNVKKLFLENKKDWPLSFKDFVIKKINWNNKVKNILSISKELNIGLESFIFLDDSDFEYNLVKSQLKKVKCIQVPKKIENYNQVLEEIKFYFNSENVSRESKSKTEQYFEIEKRNKLKNNYNNLEHYLKNLKTKVTLLKKENIDLIRASEMTLKFNQFNFLTNRYALADMKSFIKKNKILLFNVKDKFGDFGIVCLIMLKCKKNIKKKIYLENFMMSCRVFDRYIEQKIFDYLLKKLSKTYNFLEIKCSKNEKNQRFYNFFEDLGFMPIKEKNDEKVFNINLKKYKINLAKITKHINIS